MTSSTPSRSELNAATDVHKTSRVSITSKTEPAPGYVSARIRHFQERERLASELAPKAIKRSTAKFQPVSQPQAPPPTAVNQSPELQAPETSQTENRRQRLQQYSSPLSSPPVTPLPSALSPSRQISDHQGADTTQTSNRASPPNLASLGPPLETTEPFISKGGEETHTALPTSSATEESVPSSSSKPQQAHGEVSLEHNEVGSDQTERLELAADKSHSPGLGDSDVSTVNKHITAADHQDGSEQVCPHPTVILESQAPLLPQSTLPAIQDSTHLCIEDGRLTQTLSLNLKSKDTDQQTHSLTEATKAENFEQVSNDRRGNSNEASPKSSPTVIEPGSSQAEKEEVTKNIKSTLTDEQGGKTFNQDVSTNQSRAGTSSPTQTKEAPKVSRDAGVNLPSSASGNKPVENSSAALSTLGLSFGRRNTLQFHAPAFAQTEHAHEHTGRVVPPKPLSDFNKAAHPVKEPIVRSQVSGSHSLLKPIPASSESLCLDHGSPQRFLCEKHKHRLYRENYSAVDSPHSVPESPEVKGIRKSSTAYVSAKAHQRTQDEKSPWAIFERLQRKAESEAVAGTGRSIRLRAPNLGSTQVCEDCAKELAGKQAAALASDAPVVAASQSVECSTEASKSLPLPLIHESTLPNSHESAKIPSPVMKMISCAEVAEALYEDDTSVLPLLKESFVSTSTSPVSHLQTDGTSITRASSPDLVSISQALDAIISSHRRALDEVTQSLSLELGLLTGEVEGRM